MSTSKRQRASAVTRAPKKPILDMDPNTFLPGWEVNEAELRNDALGRELLRKLKVSGILPLFNKKQNFIIPSFVDQFNSTAMREVRQLEDGPKVTCLTAVVEGLKLSIDYIDIGRAYNFRVPQAPESVDQIIQDAAAVQIAKVKSMVGQFKKIPRKGFGELMSHLGYLVRKSL